MLNTSRKLFNHWEEERISLYNYFHDHTWGNEYTNIYIYSLPGKNTYKPLHTRSAQGGAHFLITRYIKDIDPKGEQLQIRRAVYGTRHVEFVNNEFCYCIRKDILESLCKNDVYVFFEFEDHYTEMVHSKDLLKKEPFYTKLNNKGDVILFFLCKGFECIEKDFTQLNPADYFHPHNIGNYQFVPKVHGTLINCIVKRADGSIVQTGHYDTIKEFFDMCGFVNQNAKYQTIREFIRNKKNFNLNGLSFVFNPEWEMVEYKTRRNKSVVQAMEALKETSIEKEIISEPKETIVQGEGDTGNSSEILVSYLGSSEGLALVGRALSTYEDPSYGDFPKEESVVEYVDWGTFGKDLD